MSKTVVSGNIFWLGQIPGTSTTSAKVGLYAGKNQDGSYKKGPVIELVGKALDGLAVKDRITAEVGHLKENIFKRGNGEVDCSLAGFAFKAEKTTERLDAFCVSGNVVADPEPNDNGKMRFAVAVNYKDKDDNKLSSFYNVTAVMGGADDLCKGDLVEVSGILMTKVGKNGDKVFRDLTGFRITKLAKDGDKGPAAAAKPAAAKPAAAKPAAAPAPAGDFDDGMDDIPF